MTPTPKAEALKAIDTVRKNLRNGDPVDDLAAFQFLKARGINPREMCDDLMRREDHHFMEEWRSRDDFIRHFSFAVPTPEAIEAIRPHAPILEVGAGSGYWAWELQRAGVDIIPTDPGTGRYRAISDDGWPTPWTDIERLTALDAIARYPTRTLLLVWPDLAEWPAEALRAYEGERVIYVGEYRGATANEVFHEILDEDFDVDQILDIPVFCGMHDRLMIYRAKGSA